MKEITIIGAGLSGSLMALLLAHRGYKVNVYEKRPDMRKETISAGRSINLALSDRGILALERAGIKDFVMEEVMPMKGRYIHDKSGSKDMQPYSGKQGNWINSVSRGGLNIKLMNAAEKTGKVKFFFEQSCENIDFDNKVFESRNAEGKVNKYNFDLLIGADGAPSAVRLAFQIGGIRRFNYSQQFLDHGYKELEIPPDDNGGFRIRNDVLHIWPRGSFMMIALPNLDGSFTCTLFMPFEGEIGFDNLDTKDKVQSFFEEYFPDALPHMPTLLEDFFTNPHDKLGTIKCFPWALEDKALLIGDAAHAVVPFYGQGMNASFEDCRILDEMIEKYDKDWQKIFDEFQNNRKADADAIADLAVQNYFEMRSHVAKEEYVIKRKLELAMEKDLNYNSKYSLVTFCPDVPYSKAKRQGEKQDEFLMKLAKKIDEDTEIDLEFIYKRLKEEAGV